jgi:hypothetical protein
MPKPKPIPELDPALLDPKPTGQITFTADSTFYTRFDERGKPTATYPVLLADVAQALGHIQVTTGLLPPDVLFITAASQQGASIGIYLPPARRTLTFVAGRGRTQTVRVHLPGFVFVGRAGTPYRIYAVKARPTGEGDTLYRAPLPNVHNHGEVCAGSVKFPTAAPNTIHAAATLFFESQFNDDLSDGKLKPARPVRSLRYTLTHLRGAFPLGRLISCGRLANAMTGHSVNTSPVPAQPEVDADDGPFFDDDGEDPNGGESDD